MQEPRSNRNIARLCAGIIACSGIWATGSVAQTYPVKPIRAIVGQGPGGGADTAARIIAPKLSEHLGQPVVVENRTGAGGSIAIERVAAAPADGYTLLVMSSSGTVQSALRSKLAYDLERDLAPVGLIADTTFVLVVHPSVPARNIKELIALALTRPGKLNYASAGIGSSAHLLTELLSLMAKVKLVHVPYKGGVEAATANAAGEVDMGFASVTAALPLINALKVRPIGVSSVKRSAFMPSIPTLDESGLPGYDRSTWYGVLAPANVPKNVVTRLNALIVQVVSTAEIKELLNKQALEPRTGTPEQFAARIHREITQNVEVVRLTGARAE